MPRPCPWFYRDYFFRAARRQVPVKAFDPRTLPCYSSRRQLHCSLRNFVPRIALLVPLFALLSCPSFVSAQNSASPPAAAAPRQSAEPAQPQSIPAEVAAAESAIASS